MATPSMADTFLRTRDVFLRLTAEVSDARAAFSRAKDALNKAYDATGAAHKGNVMNHIRQGIEKRLEVWSAVGETTTPDGMATWVLHHEGFPAWCPMLNAHVGRMLKNDFTPYLIKTDDGKRFVRTNGRLRRDTDCPRPAKRARVVGVREGECVICAEEFGPDRRRALAEPCNHANCCKGCLDKVSICPVCRGPIASRTTILRAEDVVFE